MKSTTRVIAFAVAALLSAGASVTLAKPSAKDSGGGTTMTWAVCSAQGFDATQTGLIETAYKGGMDAATIATMYGYNATNVQSCIAANGG